MELLSVKNRHNEHAGAYESLQVFLFFVHIAKNMTDGTTLHINSLGQIFAKCVLNTLPRDCTQL